MKQGYLLTQVQCVTCDLSWNMPPSIYESLDKLKIAAAKIHNDNKVPICVKPMLIEIYMPCIVSNEIFEPRPQIVLANGNGGA